MSLFCHKEERQYTEKRIRITTNHYGNRFKITTKECIFNSCSLSVALIANSSKHTSHSDDSHSLGTELQGTNGLLETNTVTFHSFCRESFPI